MVYFLCFITSAAFMHIANRTQDRKKFLLLSVVSIMITVLLAGLRDYSIGIDTTNYLTMARYWQGAVSKESLGQYMEFYMGIGYGEPLFALLCGIIAKVFGNYSVFLLVVHGIIVTCIYIGAYRFRKTVNPAFVLLLFYFVFYNHSLNIMRQYIAMAIIFAALADIPQKKYIRYSAVVILASLFHTSALLGFGALLIHWFLYCDWQLYFSIIHDFVLKMRKKRLKKNDEGAEDTERIAIVEKFSNCAVVSVFRKIKSRMLRRQIIMFSILLSMVLLFNPLCRIIIHMGLLNEKYLWYLDLSRAEHTTLITLFLLLEMSVLVVYHYYLKRRYRTFDFFFANSGAYLIMQQISMFLVYGKRVASYFSLANLVTIAMIPRMFKDKKRRLIAYALVFGVVLFYWFYSYILRNASETYPYSFVFI